MCHIDSTPSTSPACRASLAAWVGDGGGEATRAILGCSDDLHQHAGGAPQWLDRPPWPSSSRLDIHKAEGQIFRVMRAEQRWRVGAMGGSDGGSLGCIAQSVTLDVCLPAAAL